MERDSFIFYRSFYEAIKDLPRDIQGEIYTAIMEYSLNGNETDNLKPIAKSIFTLIKPLIDKNNQRFENGKKGGRPRKNETKPKPNNNQEETKQKPYVDVNVDVNVDDNVKKESKKSYRFSAPSTSEIEIYFFEKLKEKEKPTDVAKLEAEKFYNFYNSKNWMVGKNKMKNWKSAVSGWIGRMQNFNNNGKSNNQKTNGSGGGSQQTKVDRDRLLREITENS